MGPPALGKAPCPGCPLRDQQRETDTVSSPSFQHRDQVGLPWGGQAGTRGSQLGVQHGARRPRREGPRRHPPWPRGASYGAGGVRGGGETSENWGQGGDEATKSRAALEPSSLCPCRPPAPGGQGAVSVGPRCSAGTYRRCFRKP